MPINKTIVLASSNQGKLGEFSHMFARDFAAHNLTLKPQSEFGVCDAEETGLSFIENAILKARHAAKETGLAALADDSGLSVDAIGGKPGIYSARFAGEKASDKENIEKLLKALDGIPKQQRQAQFHCVLAYLRHEHDPNPQIFSGCWKGVILAEPRGENGFGYDPIFYCPKYQCASAELSAEQKHRISHRAKALALMTTHWQP